MTSYGDIHFQDKRPSYTITICGGITSIESSPKADGKLTNITLTTALGFAVRLEVTRLELSALLARLGDLQEEMFETERGS